MGTIKRKAVLGLAALLAVIIAAALCWRPNAAQAKKTVKIKTLKIKDASQGLLINKKEKRKLKLQSKPSKISSRELKWKSSNKSVVSVDQKGVIRGKKYGRAYISVKAKKNSGKKAKIRVQVGRKVEKVKLAAARLTMDAKTQSILVVSIQPANATSPGVRFTSSNKKVAAVTKEGVVKARAEGEAVITAASTDGTKKKAVCKVKVQIPSQSVALETEISPLRVSVGGTVEIDAHVRPLNASNREVTYISSNPGVARVSQSGTVTGIRAGTTVLQAKAADGRSSASVKIEVYELEVKGKKMIAHRGYSTKAPENTIPAFRLAVESGFWGVECDVRKTWDGHFVIMHDASLKRMCGFDTDVSILTLKEIQEFQIISGDRVSSYPGLKVPSLDDYLSVMAQSASVHPVIELKEAYTLKEIQKIVNMTDDYGLLDRVVFISVHQDNLLFLKSLGVLKEGQLQYVYGAEERNKVVEVDTGVLDWCIKNQIDLDARYNLLTKSAVAYMHRGGRLVNAWTVNQLQEAYEMFRDYGIDMLTTEKMLAR